MSDLLRIRGAVVRRVGEDRERSVALPDLAIAAGARVGIVGRNGCGKTSLLRVFAGLDRLVVGTFEGPPAADVAYVAAKPYLVRGTALANVALPLRARGVPSAERETCARDWLSRFGIAHLAERDRRSLSEGEAQRVALARGFAAGPRVVLLDEPLASLDGAGAELLAAAVAFRDDLTVIAVAPEPGQLPAPCREAVFPFPG